MSMENPATTSGSTPSTPTSTSDSRLSALRPHPSSSPAATHTVYGDRFIPCRARSNLALFDLDTPPSSSPYCTLLSAALFGPATPDRVTSSATACSSSSSSAASPVGTPGSGNIFRFKDEVPRRAKRALFADRDEEDSPFTTRGVRPRKIPRSPYKMLDAPEMQDDFYRNLLDWSSHDVLAVGLGNRVYLWNASRDKIWDVSRCKRTRTMEGHSMRVGALAWNSSFCSSGSRDKSILHHDIRAQEDYVSKLTAHKFEVCGLKWSYDDRQLASGGNDKRLFVWNSHSVQPVQKYTEHRAAVKAIAWSPHQHGLLASGGGTKDGCIRFWNTTTSAHLSCIDTGSQVCNLVWSKNVNELVSTHGDSQDQVFVWRYPTMSKVGTLTGHTNRVLHLALSPDGQNIATCGGDETLRIWNVFPPSKSHVRI
ncbi:hypothetical protein EJB05_21057 [Eragrostis curvula]|uniref:CDC20/Fizzy WD40 domain-containing protein n=1 Tax=Eragrostis curvula TaxID=38414 RepID=A0A5J9V269_9POAL|nr:hypothetical protein EJB05_21057 [Eragrostis curvula]